MGLGGEEHRADGGCWLFMVVNMIWDRVAVVFVQLCDVHLCTWGRRRRGCLKSQSLTHIRLTRARELSASTLPSGFTLAKAHQVSRKSEALRQFEWTPGLVLVELAGRHSDFLPQCFQTPVVPGVETSRQLPTDLRNFCRGKKKIKHHHPFSSPH